MRILLTGETGFLGRHLARELILLGHKVITAVHRASAANGSIDVDFAHDFETAIWLPRLRGIEVAINAVGILRETHKQTFEVPDARTPMALFEECSMKDFTH